MITDQLTPVSLVISNQEIVAAQTSSRHNKLSESRMLKPFRLGCRRAIAWMRRCRTAVQRRVHSMHTTLLNEYCKLEVRMRSLTADPESGAATAEYAIVLIAATAFAGVLLAVLKSGAVRDLLTGLVKKALSVA